MTFHHIGNGIIIPADFYSIIFFRGVAKNHQAAMIIYIYIPSGKHTKSHGKSHFFP